ncbi:hypothetical protein V0R50_23870 [Pseudomonas sp. 148P]|uniref:Uncharacterized protein n=1 Tax=Pseudomonas ulcerans TaxID=3115852 RepID=A0ABU7HXN3_9PSED|nr:MULTISPECIES: hypothetical protein [unclassified Pseudomonas]MEE1922174.1 hypothetical protein [Pseudomonas sp. 147P]MEE1936275.1 hypothetical protein [Pseudomonas sp. 148P]
MKQDGDVSSLKGVFKGAFKAAFLEVSQKKSRQLAGFFVTA